MKKLLIAAGLLAAVQASFANSNSQWYGLVTTDTIAADKGKACKVYDVLGLVSSNLEASRGNRNWDGVMKGIKDSTESIVQNAKSMGANVVLGVRYAYQDATHAAVGLQNPIGFSVFSYGTAAVVKCN